MKRWFEKAERFSLPVGGACVILCVLLGCIPRWRGDFFNAWEFGWIFWLQVSLGSMALAMTHVLTGGGWGAITRPIFLSAARVLPLLAVLFVPILFGLSTLFPWARADEVAHDAVLRHAHAYLNPVFFIVRFLIYFTVWSGLVWLLTHSSDERVLQRVSAAGLVFYVFLMSFAGVDWIMSRQPHWVSSVLGFVIVVSQALTAICFTLLVLHTRMDRPAISGFATPKHFRDLGNLVLMFVILWAYMNFAQYLITWTGNEQKDIPWYVQRSYGGWRVVAGILIFIHFVVPMFPLLMRPLKENLSRLCAICGALLILRILDVYWTLGPLRQGDPHGGFVKSPLDVLAWLGIGGIWFTAFCRFLKNSPDLVLPLENHGTWTVTTRPHSA